MDKNIEGVVKKPEQKFLDTFYDQNFASMLKQHFFSPARDFSSKRHCVQHAKGGEGGKERLRASHTVHVLLKECAFASFLDHWEISQSMNFKF